MGQDGIPTSIGVIIAAAVLGGIVLTGFILLAVLSI